ncbi:MAG: CsgG/HfaB family protein [Calditrichia bacterium]
MLRTVQTMVFTLTVFFITAISAAAPEWFTYYQTALQAMENQDWSAAARDLQKAIDIKDKETSKTRAYGTIFVEYYPHRELGICYYHLGDSEKAQKELNYSMKESYTSRAQEYLEKARQLTNSTPYQPDTKETESGFADEQTTESPEDLAPAVSQIVGDRLSIAVLPFESKGLADELGSIDLLDKLITGFVRIDRFKVVERALLEKILEEQKLGMSGVVDASTAARIGKGIGVDAVVVGSVTRSRIAVSIDARIIDTETAAIITAEDAFSSRISLQDISQMILDLAQQIKNDLPILNGFVINTNGDRLTIDLGRNKGLRRGMKCHVFREGAPIVHPVTGKVIAREINELCEAQVVEVFEAYSTAIIREVKNGTPKIQDRIVTK